MFGKKVIVTIHGLDWQREKWQFGFGSKFIRQGEKNAVKYADEIIVLSKGVQDYFKDTYGRKNTFYFEWCKPTENPRSGVDNRKIWADEELLHTILGRLVPEKGIRYLVRSIQKRQDLIRNWLSPGFQ